MEISETGWIIIAVLYVLFPLPLACVLIYHLVEGVVETARGWKKDHDGD